MSDERQPIENGQGRPDPDDWSGLERLWQDQAQPAPPGEDILKQVRRQEARLRTNKILEWLVAVALVSFALIQLFVEATASSVLLATVILVLVIWALNFSITNRRGLLQPGGESVQAYADLALLRIERRRRGVRFAWILYAVELAIFTLWDLAGRAGLFDTGFTLLSLQALLTVVAVTVVMVAWSFFVWRETGREMKVIASLGR